MSAALNLSIPGYPSHASTAGPSVRRPHRPESGTTLQVCNRAHQANEPNPTVKEATHRRLCKPVHYYSTALHQHIIQATSTTSGSANAQLSSTRNGTEIPEHTMPHDNAARTVKTWVDGDPWTGRWGNECQQKHGGSTKRESVQQHTVGSQSSDTSISLHHTTPASHACIISAYLGTESSQVHCMTGRDTTSSTSPQ
jgi:hypothetical protein